jgi:hypothetical protein
MAVEGQADNASRGYRLARLGDTPAVNAHVAGVDQRLRDRAAFRQADEEEEAVDPQR